MKLTKKSVAKPWGQSTLPDIFGGKQKEKIGEIWFEPPKGIAPTLMVKYLFTSEKLSIQVHPNDRLARRFGMAHGKEECWYILEAEPDAVLGIGLKKKVSATKLRTAVVLGEVESLVDWKPVKAGDLFYIPAGTIHAIGAGIQLIEVQQNIDLTYRLYDYGRPRELHLDEALAVAKLAPYDMDNSSALTAGDAGLLIDGPHFRLFQVLGDTPEMLSGVKASEWQVVPLEGQVKVRGKVIKSGECGLCPNASDIDLNENIRSLVACNMK
ncbi:class I mannose-6-phosphate isomerase [Parasphingorhabdus halotolerans]|uniref:Mannose-6-phosphate isomerase n=1 Tax=Parasphingorhabdus halotolerans TaxID=2725558 RepID=A0A6H2DJ65_9SPHN|nr:class I mannose-6-phosphate isomerase [Parasphingorhabdus halotolerans]QJB68719.1 mannose-6-phosphate isomerase [Parasphingorhabdus halotolerans]